MKKKPDVVSEEKMRRAEYRAYLIAPYALIITLLFSALSTIYGHISLREAHKANNRIIGLTANTNRPILELREFIANSKYKNGAISWQRSIIVRMEFENVGSLRHSRPNLTLWGNDCGNDLSVWSDSIFDNKNRYNVEITVPRECFFNESIISQIDDYIFIESEKLHVLEQEDRVSAPSLSFMLSYSDTIGSRYMQRIHISALQKELARDVDK